MERLIVLDTETTGLSPKEGHRIIEIGCVELLNKRKGESRQWYINPGRDIPQEAIRIHGITNERVAKEPPFSDIVNDFLAFIGEDQLVIHNARFDMGFINNELQLLRRKKLEMTRAIDTIPMARRKFPGSMVNLDSLCKKLKVNNSHRTLHGALLDADILAEVYVELTGGNQYSLDLGLDFESSDGNNQNLLQQPIPPLKNHPPRSWPPPTEEEKVAHTVFLERLHQESGNCIWLGA